jgi:hypothetical protein
MSGAALAAAHAAQFRTAVLGWLVLSAVTCALSALALASQPLGVPTFAGRIGSLFVRWGFAAGHGRLAPAVAISWLVWAVLGAALISAIRYRSDPQQELIILAWTVDILGLMHLTGIALARRSSSMNRNLLPVAGVLVVMLAVSSVLWFGAKFPGGRHLALLVAGGPPLFIGVGYGLFLLVMVTVGRGARWN